VGIEERDWYREEAEAQRTRSGVSVVRIVVGVLVVLLLIVGIQLVLQRGRSTFGDERRHVAGDVKISLLPGTEITIHHASLYQPHDPWRAYLADERTCPGAERTDLPLAQQAETMVCLVNFVRERRGLPELTIVALLNDSSVKKAEKIERCGVFEHAACGEAPDADARAAGYAGDFGENLYYGGGPLGAPRLAVDGWLNSKGHRENLFRPEWRTQGIAVQTIARFGGDRNVTLWVNEFGT